MADRLTQLQDCFDQLATQFYASLRYISTHHPPAPFPSNSQTAPAPAPPDPSSQDVPAPRPDSPATFAAAQRELAHDLVLKERQIESLISVLPGIGTSEKEQEERIRALEGELREVEEERRGAVREKEECLERLDGVIRGVKRV